MSSMQIAVTKIKISGQKNLFVQWTFETVDYHTQTIKPQDTLSLTAVLSIMGNSRWLKKSQYITLGT